MENVNQTKPNVIMNDDNVHKSDDEILVMGNIKCMFGKRTGLSCFEKKVKERKYKHQEQN